MWASSIYDWFQADFGGSVSGAFAHIKPLAMPALRQPPESIITIDEYGYKWGLADAK